MPESVNRKLARALELTKQMARLRQQQSRLAKRRRRIIVQVKDDDGMTVMELANRLGLTPKNTQEEITQGRREREEP